MNNKKEKIIIGIIGTVLVAVVSFLVFNSTRTTTAVMLASDQKAGTTITNDMVVVKEVPINTPGEFVHSKKEIVGYTLKNDVKKNEFIYLSSFLNNWEGFSSDKTIPKDYVVTSIAIPDAQAVGGLITAGDYVDVLGVSNRGVIQSFNEANGLSLEYKNYAERNQDSTQVYYVLSNVKILNTNSALSRSQGSELSATVNGGKKEAGDSGDKKNYYIVALSYDDYKKLRQAEQVFDGGLWLNIAPRQNRKNPPLIKQMLGQSFGPLHDASKPIQDENGKVLLDDNKNANNGPAPAPAPAPATKPGDANKPAQAPAPAPDNHKNNK